LKAHYRIVVNREVWEGMHRVARREDINKGGLYDARGGGAINIWCSPEDKPVGYGYEIKKGILDYPRDFVASILPDYQKGGENKVLLEMEVSPERGGTEPIGREREPTQAELNWSIQKLKELVEKGEIEGTSEEVLICPICGEEPKVILFNDFVEHIIKHGVKVKAIVHSKEGIILPLENGSVITPNHYIKKRLRK